MSVLHGEYKYAAVEADTNHTNDDPDCDRDQDRSWRPFLRQLLVCSAVWCQYFQFGLVLGSPTVIIPQMRAQHGHEYVTQEMASWMSSANSFSAVPWPAVIAVLTWYKGRRLTFALGTVTTLVGFTVLVTSKSPQRVLIGYIIQGPMAGLDMTVTLLVLTEYTSPLYRGVFLTIKSATAIWGIWVANAIGTFTHWKYIPALGLLCGVYIIVTLVVWPESPFWLIEKGRVDEGMKSHRQLKGNSESSEKELQELIESHKQDCSHKCQESISVKNNKGHWRGFWLSIQSKCFYKPLFIGLAIVGHYHLAGKFVCTVYAIDIIKSITHSDSEAYKGMLILDGITVLGMYGGCYLAKRINRRTLLFSTAGSAIAFLLITSLYLYLIRLEVITSNNTVTICFLTAFSMSISCGPMILNSSLLAEILPFKLRGECVAIFATINYAILGIVLKTAPFLFSHIGMYGAFLFYGLSSGMFLFLIYLYVPETKDKSLKEIEEMIVGISMSS